MEVGDKVLVMPSLGDNVAIALITPEVGSSVILYNLKNETRIAVPTLFFSLGSNAFNTPSFDFAGFNWSLDFNFQLIPLLLFGTNLPVEIGSDSQMVQYVDFGNFDFIWNGLGTVYISSDPETPTPLHFDDCLTMTQKFGLKKDQQKSSTVQSGVLTPELINITSICNFGYNRINVLAWSRNGTIGLPCGPPTGIGLDPEEKGHIMVG